ncbi:hypothetical protein GR927_51120 [Mycolicibacterium sp. 3033]|nr:hypothetical protein [Mycolicibacterium aurantiacum]
MTDSAAAFDPAFDEGVWSAPEPQPEPRRRRLRAIAAAVAIAAVIGGLGGAAIHAARGGGHHPGPFMVDMSRPGAPEARPVGGPAIP